MLRVRLNADIRSLDPGTNRDGNTDAVQALLFEGLVAFRENSSVGPMLAKSVAISPDGRSYTFVLRDGVKFSNGAPLTSADVLFAWHRYTDPKTRWRCLSAVDGRGALKVVDVKATDPHTVVFTLEKPSALFLATLARPDCGQTGIYSAASLNPDGSWKAPVTTAPFKVGEWKRGQSIELLRNENYVARPGRRDGLAGHKDVRIAGARFMVIPDEATAKAALLAGDIDLNPNVGHEDVAEYKAAGLKVESVPILSLNTLLIQTTDKLLGDVRMRRALLLSLDLRELTDQVTSGESPPDASPIPNASPYHTAPQSVIPKRDLAQARKLLAEAGYRGQPIHMITNKNYQTMYDQAVIAQAMAREAGIDIVLDVMDWATQLDRYSTGKYQLMSFSYSSRLDPSLSFEMFTGDKARQPRKVWDNPEAIGLLKQTMAIADPAARQPLFDRLEALYRADVPMITLYAGVRTSAARTGVDGYHGWALGSPLLWGVSLKP
jgi:peptide/nickel transport system substrate-binding protein